MISKEELIDALPLADDYREIKIAKKKGGWRNVLIPSPGLKKLQRRILRSLRGIWQNPYVAGVYGIHPGPSYIDHALLHSENRFLFQFDLENAFSSVNISELKKILIKILQNLFKKEEKAEELVELIVRLTTFRNTLPQGAPTSPFLYFLFITESGLIEKLWSLCPPGWKISCYVDDFIISGPKPLSPEKQEEIIRCLKDYGFGINPQKIRQFDCRQGVPLITGVRTDGIRKRISLPKKEIKRWRGIIHRATLSSNPVLIKKVEGFISSLQLIYGNALPAQIKKPYQELKGDLPPFKRLRRLRQTRLTKWM